MKAISLNLGLLMALIMFPQVVETIYSPALPLIAHGFAVSANQAGQTLSVYFLAFALGVVCWGWCADVVGRRPAMLGGLLLYALASVLALMTRRFDILLLVRALAAFGAAVGSVVTQTMLRDHFHGNQLAHIFSAIGLALAISPAIGMLVGGILVGLGGYLAVFVALALLALALWLCAWRHLPETRPEATLAEPSRGFPWRRMLADWQVWRAALLVAGFNVSVFSYYQLAPFQFQQLALGAHWYSISGVWLACGLAVGSWLNGRLIRRQWGSNARVRLGALCSFMGALALQGLAGRLWFFLPIGLVGVGFGVAIPNVLAMALAHYADCRGRAGALLGLAYYLMIGMGLLVAGYFQRLGPVLMVSGAVCLLLTLVGQASGGVRDGARL